ncbi:GNAT family N-acetyltransferase [Microtetraspora sp. AC03309]|uniref:GNAT family N-acetyltransferase n=1 Tax=Microtetraspora sp. AC03309 TaxID=2779376 RepID=UPI001E2D53F3|nr:GNAT family N-acetyltransferase [Microtetraspora sp. AC03309]MCC5581717.1 GNAT family N-acetyltransferase [Microtetraspora sp. AC03309]
MPPPRLDMFVLREGVWKDIGSSVLQIRRQVFQDEQGIARHLDEDGQDEDCLHFLVETAVGEPVGTARMWHNHLQRLAVLDRVRNQGIGFLLVASMLRTAHVQRFGHVEATAQPSALGLARLFGFDVDPVVREIAGRPHHRVSKQMIFEG